MHLNQEPSPSTRLTMAGLPLPVVAWSFSAGLLAEFGFGKGAVPPRWPIMSGQLAVGQTIHSIVFGEPCSEIEIVSHSPRQSLPLEQAIGKHCCNNLIDHFRTSLSI